MIVFGNTRSFLGGTDREKSIGRSSMKAIVGSVLDLVEVRCNSASTQQFNVSSPTQDEPFRNLNKIKETEKRPQR